MKELKPASKSRWTLSSEFPRGDFAENKVLELEKRDLAIVLYDFEEERMGIEYAKIALLEDVANPQVGLRSLQLKALVGKQTIFVDRDEQYLIFSRQIHRDGKWDCPFIIVDLSTYAFSFLPMPNAKHYAIRQETDGSLELERLLTDDSFPNRDGVKINVSSLTWHVPSKLDSMADIYSFSS